VKAAGRVEPQLVPWELCQQWAELEPEEVESDPVGVPADWPQVGKIEFRQACLRYAPDLPVIVQDATFIVPAHSHVALLGRTGAGKSTVLFLGPLRESIDVEGIFSDADIAAPQVHMGLAGCLDS